MNKPTGGALQSMPFQVDWSECEIANEAKEAWIRSCGAFVYLNAQQLWADDGRSWRQLLASRYTALYDVFNYGIASPIEAVMAGHLVWLEGPGLALVEACHEPWFDDGYEFDANEFAFSVQPQVEVGKYRADFMVLIRGPNGIRRIAIECDGHDFHEKTKEQAARDKRRDREFLLAGVQVMRFTGSEIWKDGLACFVDVQKAVYQAAAEVGYRHA